MQKAATKAKCGNHAGKVYSFLPFKDFSLEEFFFAIGTENKSEIHLTKNGARLANNNP